MNPISMVAQFGKRVLLSKFGSSAIGLIALIALIWFAGPYLGLSAQSHRVYAIVVLLALFALFFLASWLLARRRGNALKTQIGGSGGEAEIDAIREKMSEAIGSLKSSQLGGGYSGSAALYALPWYMVIGPSAAGKSTLLRNSGLHFPYADADDLHFRGVGGTRNCDWWFSDQAVLLDTAGRYTTEEDDREEWFTFLELLRKQRKRTPINGVLVAISVSDLLTSDADALERHVKIIRERINELMHRLGLLFPIFLVFTKTDLVPGFEEFFEDLSDSERDQLWGAYLLESSEQSPAELFEQHMGQLYQKLCELRLRKLSMQRKFDRKSALYGFPDQFKAAAEKLAEFVHLLFRDNPYQETPRFAGAYFTSGTQEGTPLTRLVGNLRQAFGFAQREQAPRNAPPKSFFIHRLFTDVVIPLQGYVNGNRKRLILQRGLKTAAMALGLVMLVGTLGVLSASYGSNKLLLNKGIALSEKLNYAFQDDRYDSIDRYQVLADVFAHYQTLKGYEQSRPWRFRVGVYSGDSQIPALEGLLETSMDRFYRQDAFRSLELSLENMARSWDTSDRQRQEALREDYYSALKTYLMLSRAPARMDTAVAVPVLNKQWLVRRGLAAEPVFETALSSEQHSLYALADFYLQRKSSAESRWNAKQELIDQGRRHLQTPPNAEQMYAQVISRGASELSPYGIDEMLERSGLQLLGANSSVAGVYTRAGWDSFVRPQIDARIDAATRGDWVLTGQYHLRDGESADGQLIDEELASQLREQIRELYFADYADAWIRFVGDVRIRRFQSLDDGVKRLDQLARSGGPIGQLMNVISRNLTLYEAAPSLAEKAPDGVDALRSSIRQLDDKTTELRRFTTAAEQRSVSDRIHQFLTILSALKVDMEQLALAVDVGREAELYAGSILGRGGSETELYKSWVTISSLLGSAEPASREAFRPLFEGVVRETWRNVLLSARDGLADQWQQEVVASFEGRLKRKFPFDASGADASLDDVTDFFQPGGGRIWRFVDDSMSPFIDKGRRGWEERLWLDQGLGLSATFLSSLASANVISESLFGRNGRYPEMSFHLYPLPARGVSEILLESNGQSYRYQNGPQEWQRFTWPGDESFIGARVAGVSRRGQMRDELKESGQWGLFRLLNKAAVSREGGAEFILQWELNGGLSDPLLVRYRLRADRQANVFGQRLSSFMVPADILRPLAPVAGSVLGAG